MSRLHITAAIAILAAIAGTYVAHLGDVMTTQLAQKARPDQPPTRTRIITSIFDTDPAVVGSIPRQKPGEIRR